MRHRLATIFVLPAIAMCSQGCLFFAMRHGLSSSHVHSAPMRVSTNYLTATRSVESFQSIDVSGAFEVVVGVGPATSLKVECPAELMNHVRTTVVDGKLMIEPVGNYSSDGPIKVRVTTPTLTELNVSGASNATVNGVATNQFKLVVSGAGHCEMEGKVERLEAEASGSGHVVWDDLNAQSLTLKAEGAGQFDLSGSANTIKFTGSGAGQLDASDLHVKEAKIEAEGASSVKLDIADRLDATASGASHITYTGAPKNVNANSTGASSIDRD